MYDQWGITQQSDLFTNLVDAFQNDYFNIQPYKDELGNNNEELDQILLQQYSYWLITTWMDLVVDYGPPLEVVEEEWQLYTPVLLQEKQPDAYALCVDTLTELLAIPTNLPDYVTDTAADVEPDNKDPDKEEDEDTEQGEEDGSGNPWDDEEDEEGVDVETSEVEEEPIETSSDANTIVIANWYLPYTGLRTVSVNVGDTLTFDWSVEGDTAHNVYLHPTMDCSLDDRSEVGVTSPTSYTFTEADGSVEGNTMFFSCDIGEGQHCEAGTYSVTVVQCTTLWSCHVMPCHVTN